ncbi:hypothetical protein CAEBREN_13306 [Caenorhabditis brenneri]|uniref:F-box domain-containing protein n=1 Tax=Caenorhabditis brenneri TaxID=135651 RepID=G0N1M6_CAEBE|nr:hypothetical protein CAEBREN_13306 [Caenorhabditis brenneri]
MPSLLDMTDVPMINILEKCDYKSVLTLRKVCHSLRNFIDDACFKTDLAKIRIAIGPTGFSVTCHSNAYWTNEIGIARNWTSDDLKIFLKMAQNSKLFDLYVKTHPDSSGGFDDLEEILKNQTRPLKTERFTMEGAEILKVLPHLDSETLKEIIIKPANYKFDYQNLDGIEQFLELQQFKNAVSLIIDNCFLVRADLRKFFHFQGVSVKIHEPSLEELAALKEAFVSSTHMEFFNLNVRGLDENQLEQVFGTPFHDPRGWQWFFEIQNYKEHVLRIEWTLRGLIFWKMEAKEVPQDAVVQH